MRTLKTALPIALLAGLVITSPAQATFGGTNGRVFSSIAPFSSSATIVSVCPTYGDHPKTVATHAEFPAPSPDGTKVAYLGLRPDGNNDGIWVADADGSGKVQIADASWSPIWPTWSPDGTKLTWNQNVFYEALATSQYQPVVADVATKVVTPLLHDQNFSMNPQAQASTWTPDGLTIYFQGGQGVNGEGSDVYEVAATGGTAQRRMGTDAVLPFFQSLDFAPDGQTYLAAKTTSHSPVTTENWRYPTAGGAGTLLSTTTVDPGTGVATGNESYTFSPDGTKILYDRVSDSRIMVANPNGSGETPLGTNFGNYPRWSTNDDDCTDPGASSIKVNEVALGSAPFVELLDPADETFPPAQGPYAIAVYDAAGARIGSHTISSTLLQGRDNTKPLLISSAAADAALGVAGDERLEFGLPDVGQACFVKGAGQTKVDCVSWGCVATLVAPSSTRIPGAAAGSSSQRQGVGSTTFQIAAPTPKATNVAGVAQAACAPTTGDGSDGTAPGGGNPGNPSAGAPSVTATPGGGRNPSGPAAPGAPGSSPSNPIQIQSSKQAFPVTLPRSRTASSLAKGWSITVTSPAKGTLRATLTVGGKVIASGSAAGKAGKKLKLTLKATKSAKSKLAGFKKKPATLTVSIAGKVVTQTLSLG